MPSLFRRKPEVLVEDAIDAAAAAPDSPQRPKSYTPSKKELGVVTPKRRAGGRPVEPPPANRREAMRRARQKQREARAEARAGMMEGKEEFLLSRDKGPERALVRDIVDARRNVATYFLPAAIIVILGSSQSMPPVVQVGANLFWFLLALGVIVDSFLLTRKIRRTVAERFPKSTGRHGWYAIMRSLSFRRMRMPKPRVTVGAKV